MAHLKGEAKSGMMRVRHTTSEKKALAASAKADGKELSEWTWGLVRGRLNS